MGGCILLFQDGRHETLKLILYYLIDICSFLQNARESNFFFQWLLFIDIYIYFYL